VALALMVIPGLIVAYLFAYNIFEFQTFTLVSTLVIVMTFLGTTVAAVILPWRAKDVFEGSPIAKFKVPSWLGWIGMLLFVAGGAYLIVTSFGYGYDVLTSLSGADAVTWFMALLVATLTVINAVVILWLIYYVGKRILGGGSMPLITFAGLIFFIFLDWLLIEWFWDPGAYYGIGWSNTNSMSFMIGLYVLAAVIYFGFSAYRKRQGIDVDKVYQEIPVE